MVNNINVDKSEVLRYLGYRGQEIDKLLDEKIDDAIKESFRYFRVKYVYEIFNISKKSNGILVEGTNLYLRGNDIEKLLENSDRCVLMAATLGNDIEKKIRYYEKLDLTKSIILDAASTTAIEDVCDKVEIDIKNEYLKEGEHFTFRYSPGYGDLKLDIQKDFIKVLNCERKIGLNVSEHMILFPRKSVTAILGIVNKKEERKRDCTKCICFENCPYRRESGFNGCERISKK